MIVVRFKAEVFISLQMIIQSNSISFQLNAVELLSKFTILIYASKIQ